MITSKPKSLFVINCKRYYFAPTWLPTLITLIILPVLILLGCWQLNRAAEKQLLEQQFAKITATHILNLNEAHTLPADPNFHPVQITGHFDNTHQFLQDNQFYNHQVGYYVLTPFLLDNSQQAVLVNRGWIAQGKSRAHLPDVNITTTTLTLRGAIHVLSKKQFMLKDAVEQTWPRRIQQIDIAQISAELHKPLYPFTVLLNADQPYGFTRAWSTANYNPAKHYGYAFQWFALAVTLIIIYIVVNTHRKESDCDQEK